MQAALIAVLCLLVIVVSGLISAFLQRTRHAQAQMPATVPAGLALEQLDEWKSVTEVLRNRPQRTYAPPQTSYTEHLAARQSNIRRCCRLGAVPARPQDLR